WAAAADWPPPINLLRARRRQASKAMLKRVAIVTGAAAGLGIGLGIVRGTDPTAVRRVVSKAPALLGRATPAPLVTKPLVARSPIVPAKPTVATKPQGVS